MVKFFEEIKDYLGWWIIALGAVIVVAQVPGCTQLYQEEETKRIQTITAHCEKQGKTFFDDSAITGMCV